MKRLALGIELVAALLLLFGGGTFVFGLLWIGAAGLGFDFAADRGAGFCVSGLCFAVVGVIFKWISDFVRSIA